MSRQMPENLYTGELVSYPGPWSFHLGKSAIILVSDQELEMISSDPDKEINMSLGNQPQNRSLRQICERARVAGHRTLIIAFDHFFSQYRPGQAGPRKLTPDMDEYVKKIAAVSRFASQYGLKLELSLLSPLEIGPAYQKATGESGRWMHYRKGLRDPKTGSYSVQLWRQQKWCNNKGFIDVKDAGVRVFAFQETMIHGTNYRAVDPAKIVEITDTARVEVWGDDDSPSRRIRVYGTGGRNLAELDRVLVVQQYVTPEMDYFSPKALPFLKKLLDKYADAGVDLNAFYSDEMHIQQDWGYFSHHDHGTFALRYVSKGLEEKFASLYGKEYRDFAKYLVYFTYGQEDFANDLSARSGVMHVFGSSPEDIRRTALFRANYYHLLQDGVVDLFVQAKEYAEERAGYVLETRAHATWAESPTIDYWDTAELNQNSQKYEYTSNFVWSNTVHQAASACYDYFKWGEFLTGTGNDHCECGWADRNYVGLALACSTGMVNEIPYSYAAHWGMPHELMKRRNHLVNIYGAAGSPLFGMVQDMQHREVDVLMLYPIDLVALDERFGSWMTQYGYANMITQSKLVETGRIKNGAVEVAGHRFTTLAAACEPFPSVRLLEMMREMAVTGGRVIWSGPVPLLTSDGKDALGLWQEIFGVTYKPGRNEGRIAPGRLVEFEGVLSDVTPQVILTDLLVDHIYPVQPREGTTAAARVGGDIVGTHRPFPGGGCAVFLGYRPRDDQSKSLGYETRNWFEVLSALGAYPPTGRFPDTNDNTEYISRTSDYLACRFPNGTVAICPHFRETVEDWQGGFARDEKSDKEYLDRFPPPSEELNLKDFRVNGHTVSYNGTGALAFRLDKEGSLAAFSGGGCSEITIDGRKTVFADKPVSGIAWAPVQPERRVPGGAVLQIMMYGTGTVRIPDKALPEKAVVVVEGPKPGSRGNVIASSRENGALVFTVPQEASGRWIYVTTP